MIIEDAFELQEKEDAEVKVVIFEGVGEDESLKMSQRIIGSFKQ
jgi:hypothetical protein